jgi:hypothetical protein
MTIHTARSRRAVDRRLDRLNVEVERVVNDLAHGNFLHLRFDRRHGALWTLTGNGRRVEPEIAKLVIARPDVIAAGDALFPGCTSQIYRHADADDD